MNGNAPCSMLRKMLKYILAALLCMNSLSMPNSLADVNTNTRVAVLVLSDYVKLHKLKKVGNYTDNTFDSICITEMCLVAYFH